MLLYLAGMLYRGRGSPHSISSQLVHKPAGQRSVAGGGGLTVNFFSSTYRYIGIFQRNICRKKNVIMIKLKIGMLILDRFLQHFIIDKSSTDKRLLYILGVKYESFFKFIIKCNRKLNNFGIKRCVFLFMKEFISRLWKIIMLNCTIMLNKFKSVMLNYVHCMKNIFHICF